MEIKIKKNIYDINLNDLIVIANRVNNEKRNFLFVSKILGKHIEVKPDICKAMGYILASLICRENRNTKEIIDSFKNKNNLKDLLNISYECEEKITVLGFAETATGLGMSVASAIEDSFYLTTTRENIIDINSMIKFEEEHSHATTHKCYLENLDRLISSERIILVDDEITTGKSMLNIIKELKEVTGINKYSILSILDWRGKEYLDLYEKFKEENKVEIEVLSLISGCIKNEDKTIYYDEIKVNKLEEKIKINDLTGELERKTYKTKKDINESYLSDTGRFGTTYEKIKSLEEKCERIAKKINGKIGENKKVLVLGHGENIYIPSRIASYLDGDIKFKSTTRSPIYCSDEEGYPIIEKHSFTDRGVEYYFYNRSKIEEKFDYVVLLVETDLDIKLTDNIIIFKI